jgi:hypothetical protein
LPYSGIKPVRKEDRGSDGFAMNLVAGDSRTYAGIEIEVEIERVKV